MLLSVSSEIIVQCNEITRFCKRNKEDPSHYLSCIQVFKCLCDSFSVCKRVPVILNVHVVPNFHCILATQQDNNVNDHFTFQSLELSFWNTLTNKQSRLIIRCIYWANLTKKEKDQQILSNLASVYLFLAERTFLVAARVVHTCTCTRCGVNELNLKYRKLWTFYRTVFSIKFLVSQTNFGKCKLCCVSPRCNAARRSKLVCLIWTARKYFFEIR